MRICDVLTVVLAIAVYSASASAADPAKDYPNRPIRMSGESQWTMTPAPAVWSLVKSGRLRAIAHSLPQRTPLLGDLPAVAETIPGYDYSGWNGLIAPRGTPKPILDKVRAALLKTMSLPEVKDTMAAQATKIATNTPEQFRKLALEALKKYSEVVKAVGLKVE